MTTAFVLGGGGLLGAHEVGMPRALSEAGIRPDLVAGTSIGAINGAFVAADPRQMPNLLPPRPGGTLAGIAACPDADVIFVAHAGLDTILSISDVWRRFPVDQVIRARWWRVPFDQVPRDADHEAQLQWLFGWWERIDS